MFFKLFTVAGVGLIAAGVALDLNVTMIVVGAFWVASFGFFAWLTAGSKEAAARRAEIMSSGIPADVTVKAAEGTGVFVNERPQMRMRLHVKPHDGSPEFEVAQSMVVPFEGIGALSGTHAIRGFLAREDRELVIDWARR